MEEVDKKMKLEEKVFSYIEKYKMIETGSHVIVGISGGADSVCLLFLLKEYQKQREFFLCGVHVNHGIRGEEALEDQQFSEELCRGQGIDCSVYTCSVPEYARQRRLSLEEAGRIIRKKAFAWRGEKLEGDFTVALAHHENDNAETVIHNLLRGTGAAGLGGIRPVQKEEFRCIRPLLCVSKKEIMEYLREKQISWKEDSTNRETEYTRNKIRLELLPKMEEINRKAVSHISAAAGILIKIEEYLQEQTDMLYRKYITWEGGRQKISSEMLEEKEIMQSYLLKRVLEKATGKKADLESCHVEALRALFGKETGARISLASGLCAWQSYGTIYVGKEEDVEKTPLPAMEFEIFLYENQQIPEKTYTKWFDYDKIVQNLEIRRRKTGDYLTINSLGGVKKLKDYFIDCKIPRENRDNIALLADGSHILWAVGYRISEYYKVTSQTKQVLKVQVKGAKEDE